MTILHDIHQLGQSTWLNHLRDNTIRSGELARYLTEGIQGLTADALIYGRAIAGSHDYDDAIRSAVEGGIPIKRIHESLIVNDVQRAADVMLPVFEESNHYDGFVSLELDPATLHDVAETVAEVRHIGHLIDRNNVMVEIPATPSGIQAIRALVADGVSVNATHLFSIEDYERVAQAYISGLDDYINSHSVWRRTPTAVASFSLAPIDAIVDPLLDGIGRSDLRGRTAIALAKVLYTRYRSIFSGPLWDALASRGARTLRPKWTRTTPQTFHFPETHYVQALIGPGTITTFSTSLLSAFRHSGIAGETLTSGMDEAHAHLQEMSSLGINLASIAGRLQRAHLHSTDRQYQMLVQAVMHKRDAMEREWQSLSADLGDQRATAAAGLQTLCRERVVCRIMAHDYTVWKPTPIEITNRLGWLHIGDKMAAQAEPLRDLARRLRAEGIDHALLLGMGGSSLAPELFYKTFGRPAQAPSQPYPHLDLTVLDTTDPDATRTIAGKLDPRRTIVIVATKSGGTVETLSGFKYFYNLMQETLGGETGKHFIAITDPGSSLVDLATRYSFREIFLNDPTIGGRYSALSYFGLVPAALVGVDLATLLARAGEEAANAAVCDCDAILHNRAAQVGTIMGLMAQKGRDKLTFITSLALASFGDWVEQLVAESMGKEGKGILPVVGEPVGAPTDYGQDRLFVHLRLEGDDSQDEAVAALAAAGHPVLTLRLRDVYDVGAQFLLWEMATAIAGYWLQINPFDQPNVESAKIEARAMVDVFRKTGTLPAGEYAELSAAAIQTFLAQARPGDYVSIQAYTTPSPAMDDALATLRAAIGRRTGLATTVGYGPRFLHSTGQLHKGDAGNGLFIQLVSSPVKDIMIPDEAGKPEASMSFGILKESQALGDAQALRGAKRRVMALHVGADPVSTTRQLAG